MRYPDLPECKREIMSKYFGKLVEFFESEGLFDGQEFASTMQDNTFLLPRYYIHIFDKNKKRNHQIVIVFNPIEMEIGYGVATKNPSKTIYRQS